MIINKTFRMYVGCQIEILVLYSGKSIIYPFVEELISLKTPSAAGHRLVDLLQLKLLPSLCEFFPRIEHKFSVCACVCVCNCVCVCVV